MIRREFIRAGCSFCAGLATAGLALPLLESCAPAGMIFKAEPVNGWMSVPISEMAGKNYLRVRTAAVDYDLLIVKDSETSFHTLLMLCTHRQQPLTVSSGGLVCNEHGSRFDWNGAVIQDPATQSLKQYETRVTGQTIEIKI